MTSSNSDLLAAETAILRYLFEEGESIGKEIKEEVGCTKGRISQLTNKLNDENLVKFRKDGRKKHYSINEDKMEEVQTIIRSSELEIKLAEFQTSDSVDEMIEAKELLNKKMEESIQDERSRRKD